jgi:hypothetical protein
MDIKLKVGDKVITKKSHACGGNTWTVTRTGADVKLTCEKCNHTVLLTLEKALKSIKEILD